MRIISTLTLMRQKNKKVTENGANIQEVKANVSLVSQKTEENGAKIEQVQTQVDETINIINYININDTIMIIKGD